MKNLKILILGSLTTVNILLLGDSYLCQQYNEASNNTEITSECIETTSSEETFINTEETTNEKLLGLELRRLNINEGQDDLYNNIADIYKKNWYRIEVNEEDITQAIGFNKKLNYLVFKDNDTVDVEVVWESSNTNVAEVDNQGNLKIIGAGQSVVTCYMKDSHEVKWSFVVTGIFKEELPKAEE